MRFGYWMPIFGGWLRNVRDEGMPVAWPYVRDLAIESEQHGFDLSLINASLSHTYEKRALQHQAALDLALELEKIGRQLRGPAQ